MNKPRKKNIKIEEYMMIIRLISVGGRVVANI
jgi:hypothetical protein